MSDTLRSSGALPELSDDTLCMFCTRPDPMLTRSRVANDLELQLCIDCKHQLAIELFTRAYHKLHHHWRIATHARRATGMFGPYLHDMRFGRTLEELEGNAFIPELDLNRIREGHALP